MQLAAALIYKGKQIDLNSTHPFDATKENMPNELAMMMRGHCC